MKKKVGDKISMVTSGWSFDHINKKFDKHILRSVPFYEEFHRISLKLSEFFIGEKTSILDIGCSTGTLLNDFSSKYPKKNYKIEFIGIDPVSSMIRAAKKKNKDKRVKFITKSLLDTNFKNFDFITSVLTIQFIHPSQRQSAYKKIYHSLKRGGAFLVFEKIRAENSKFEDINTGIYFDFKRSNGFSEEEINQKTLSLRGKMECFTPSENVAFLKKAGFSKVSNVFKWFCFEGNLCIK